MSYSTIMKLFLTLPIILVALLVFCPLAQARRAATTTERSQMQVAIRANSLAGNKNFIVAPQTYVSTVNSRWAYINGTVAIGGHATPADTIMFKRLSDNHWIMKNQLITWQPCSWKALMGTSVFNDVVHLPCGG